MQRAKIAQNRANHRTAQHAWAGWANWRNKAAAPANCKVPKMTMPRPSQNQR